MQRAVAMKEQQRLYFKERNMMEESRYEQHNQAAFAAGVNALYGGESFDGLSRSASATLASYQVGESPGPGERWAEAASMANTPQLRASASSRSFEWLMDA